MNNSKPAVRPYLTWYKKGNYCSPDARLLVNREGLVFKVEYPCPSAKPTTKWADKFIGLPIWTVAGKILGEFPESNMTEVVLMKDCW